MDVIVTNSFLLLRAYLRGNDNSNGFYLSSSAGLRFSKVMDEHGVTPIKPVVCSSGRQESILRDHIDVIGKLSEWNGHIPHWWTTDISSKNVYRTPLLPLLREFTEYNDAIEVAKDRGARTLFIFGVSWPVIIAMRQAAFEGGWRLRELYMPGSRALAVMQGKVRAWSGLSKSAVSIIKEIAITGRSYGNQAVPVEQGQPVYLIKSFVYPDSFDGYGKFKDPFFGRLAEHLTEALKDKVRVISIVLGFSEKPDCYKKLRQCLPNVVIPLESMLRYRDVAKHLVHLSLMVLLRPFKVKGKIRFLRHDITGLLHELLSSGGWRIPFYQYIYCAAGKRLVKKYSIAACAITHESNPWERAFITGLKKCAPQVRIIGYQHSVIHLASANMFQSSSELDILPMPDIVLTTGDMPTNILRRFGAVPAERINTSCALRYDCPTYNHRFLKSELAGHSRLRILVALCGVIETMGLVRYTIDQARVAQNIDFLVRAHPVLPFDQLKLSEDDLRNMPDNIRVSKDSTVMDDVMECDLVLYWGSSVSLEGIRLGRPVIHFHQDDFLSYDPLFELTEFKWVVNPQDSITKVVEKIRSISDNEFDRLQDSARRYVIAYHNPVSIEALSPFLEF